MGSVGDFFKFPLVPILDLATRKYIAGAKLEDALAITQCFQNVGCLTTVGFWSSPCDDFRRNILLENYRALTGLSLAQPGSCLSVNFAHCKMLGDLNSRVLETLVSIGQERGVHIQLDASGHVMAQRMWDEIEVLIKKGGYLGGTLPARWKRSLDDASRLKNSNLRLRLVKGKRPDPNEKDRRSKNHSEIRQIFLNLVERLAGRKSPVVVATHDFRLAQESLIYLQRSSTPCELELLYGVPTLKLFRWAKKMGISVRFYIPYGKGILPYSVSDFPRNPRLIGRFLKDAFMNESQIDQIQKLISI